MTDIAKLKPNEARTMFRSGDYIKPTAGMCEGYVQGNLVILPKDLAYDFLLFAHRNPEACPILEVTDMGSREFSVMAKDSDIANDLPLYRIYESGELTKETESIEKYFKPDYISFLIGCSFTFESALIEAGISIRHIDMNRNVPMYKTNIECKPAGIFSGPMVVSMRPMTYKDAIKATKITSRYPKVHGSPIHIGDPKLIGIDNIDSPDFGDSVDIKENEIPVFWPCGVTTQAVALNAKPSIMITHSPGYMFITDIKNTELRI